MAGVVMMSAFTRSALGNATDAGSRRLAAAFKKIWWWVFPVLIGLLGGELAGQLWFNNPRHYFDARLAYVTPEAIRNVDKFWTYRPDSQITEILIYKEPFGDFSIKSSCDYTTDENGFLENPDRLRHYDWLILGDSFVAGQAGCSWMSELRRLLPGKSIYNAALMGVGVEDWAAYLSYLEQRGYSFDRILVAFISVDFFRKAKSWPEVQIHCLREAALCQKRHFYYPISKGSDLIETSKHRTRLSFLDEVELLWRRHFWVSNFLFETAAQSILGGPPPKISASTTAAFEKIRGSGHAVQFLRFPEKAEIAVGAQNAFSQLVDAFFRSQNLTYQHCNLRYEDFLDYDAHPSREGYARLAACVAEHLKPR